MVYPPLWHQEYMRTESTTLSFYENVWIRENVYYGKGTAVELITSLFLASKPI